jgi:hypothetical protein
MSTDSDFMWSLLNDSAKAELPFFAPLPQADAPSAESFDDEIEELDFDGPVPLPILENTFSTFRDSTPVFTSPSIFTHSTESGCDVAASEYSYVGYHPPSNYSVPLDMAFQGVRVSSEYGGVDTMHDPIYSSPYDFGALPPSPSASPPLRMAKAQSDYGPSKPRNTHFGISPENLSLPQAAPPSVPALLPVPVASDTLRHSGSGRTHQCPNCSRGKADSSSIFSYIAHFSQPSRVHLILRHTWTPIIQKDQNLSCVRTAAAKGLSAANMIYNVTARLSIATRLRPRQFTRIHPESPSPPLVLHLVTEHGARSVERDASAVREAASAVMSSKPE